MKEILIKPVFTRSCSTCQNFVNFSDFCNLYYIFCSQGCRIEFVKRILLQYNKEELKFIEKKLKLSLNSTLVDKARVYENAVLTQETGGLSLSN